MSHHLRLKVATIKFSHHIIFLWFLLPVQWYYLGKVYTFDQNLCKLKLCIMRNIYITVCHCLPKNFPMRMYGITKLSKPNITWQDCTENSYYHQLFVCAKPFWIVLIWLGFRDVLSRMAFQTHPLIPRISTNSMALSKI